VTESRQSSSEGTVLFEVRDRVAVVTLNRPDKMNAMNVAMRVGLVETWRRIAEDRAVWAVVLTGAGKAFCAGHDLVEKPSAEEKLADPGTAAVYGGLWELEKPVIAAINGICLAQGAGLALLTDIRIAADHVQFGWPQARRGIGSVSGPTMLTRMIPRNLAFEYLFTGESFDAARAKELSLVNHVLPADEVLPRAIELAATICQNAPLAVSSIKRDTIQTAGMGQVEAFRVVSMSTALLRQTDDAQEGMAAFREKRAPAWTAR
jgi:enoyl-CoA hydratase/carnithine racemase